MNSKSIPMVLLRSLLISLLLSLICLVCGAGLLYAFHFSQTWLRTIVFTFYGATNAIGGFLTGKGVPSRKFLWGLVSGGLYVLVLFLLGFLFYGMEGLSLESLGLCAIIALLCSMIGAIVS